MVEPSLNVFCHALQIAGLPSHPELIRNHGFLFFDDSGHYISSSIVSIGYAATEGVTLRISSPRFRGLPIRCLKQVDGVWAVIPEISPEEKAVPFSEGPAPFKGEFILF